MDLNRRVVGAEPEWSERFYDGEAISELLANLIDGCDQIVIVDLPPLVARKQAVSCR